MNNKPWLNIYPAGMPTTIDIESSKTLIDIIEEAFQKYKKLPMLSNMGKTLLYQDIDKLSKQFGSYIQNFTTLKPGDHVAIQLPNILQFPVVALGFLRAGMVLVNINPLYTAYEMKKQLKDVQAKAIVILESFAHKLETILPETDIESVIVTKLGDLLGTVKGGLVNLTAKYIKKIVPLYNIPNLVYFKEALKKGLKKELTYYKTQGDSIALIQYTGGTTGTAKGAMLTHTNLVVNIEQMKYWLNNKLKEGKETMITALPLYHIFSFTINLLTMMKIGAKNILIANPKNIRNFIKDFKKNKPTCFTGVNTLFNNLLEHKSFSKINFSSLHFTLSGGTSLSKTVAKAWESLTGVPVLEAYGLTEASPAVIGNPINGLHKLGSVGVPIPNTEAMIVNDSFEAVAQGTSGNLIVKGPQVMRGYWKNPEETLKTLKNGWLITGDVASMDAQGFITILERKKDMINISGFNVYPAEIEEVALLHPGVKEAAVVGAPLNEFKDKIKLFIVKNYTSLAQEEILEHCKKYLTNYKIPQEVIFLDELPKSIVGKVLRKELKAYNIK